MCTKENCSKIHLFLSCLFCYAIFSNYTKKIHTDPNSSKRQKSTQRKNSKKYINRALHDIFSLLRSKYNCATET